MVTTTTSAARAASAGVAAQGVRAELGDDVGQRLGSAAVAEHETLWPAATASRATVLPMFPLPMKPQVVMVASTARSGTSFRSCCQPGKFTIAQAVGSWSVRGWGVASRPGPKKSPVRKSSAARSVLRGDLAVVAEPVEHVGEPVAAEHRRAVHELEVQVRGVGVAGVAQPGDDLALLDLVARLDQQGALLQVGVEGEGAAADVQDDVVAVDVLDRQLRSEDGIVGGQDAGRVGVDARRASRSPYRRPRRRWARRSPRSSRSSVLVTRCRTRPCRSSASSRWRSAGR